MAWIGEVKEEPRHGMEPKAQPPPIAAAACGRAYRRINEQAVPASIRYLKRLITANLKRLIRQDSSLSR